MKKGESFKKIINEKGRTIQTIIFLSPDEISLILVNKRCCASDETIYIVAGSFPNKKSIRAAAGSRSNAIIFPRPAVSFPILLAN